MNALVGVKKSLGKVHRQICQELLLCFEVKD